MNHVATHANLFGLSNLPGIYLRGSTLPSYFIETPTCFLLNLPYMESSWIITATIFLPFVRRTGFYWQGETNSVHSSGIAGILYCCSLQCIWIITLRYTFFLGLCGVCVNVWCACVWVFTDVYQSDNFESFETGSVCWRRQRELTKWTYRETNTPFFIYFATLSGYHLAVNIDIGALFDIVTIIGIWI